MRVSVPRVLVLCAAVVGSAALGYVASAEQTVTLDYEPSKGDSTTYALRARLCARDEEGLGLIAHGTSTVEIKVLDIKRDPNVPVDQNNIVEAVLEIAQKDGSVKFVSGEEERTSTLEDSTVKIVTDSSGAVKQVLAGEVDKSVVQTVTDVCSRLGATERPELGDEWTVPVELDIMGEAVAGKVTYKLSDTEKVDGADSVLITSSGKASHNFESKGPIKSIVVSWRGKAYYAHEHGRFALVVVQGNASGTLEDDTMAAITEFSFEMSPVKKQAFMPPEEKKKLLAGFTGGGGGPLLPALLGVATVLGLAVCIVNLRRPVVRRVLVCSLAVVIVIYGTPLDIAEATGPDALLAFARLGTQALFGACGLTAAGGAGVCMTGAKAGVLSTSCAMIPTWPSAGIRLATGQLEAGFVQVTAGEQPVEGAVAGAAATSGGFFSPTNMLIGGGVIAASAGVGVAAAGGGGGGGGNPCPTTQTFDAVTTTAGTMTAVLKPRANEGPDPSPDSVQVFLNDNPMGTVVIDGPKPVVLTPVNMGANELKFKYAGGGDNNCAIFEAILTPTTDPGGTHLLENIWIAPESTTGVCTITRQ